MENVKMNVKEFLLKCINNNEDIEDYFFMYNGAFFPIEESYITGREITLRNCSYDISIDIPLDSEQEVVYDINI